jgi:hypothetical protein
MEARQKLIERGTRRAYALAAAGETGGVILSGDPWDTTDLMKGAGFSTAAYDSKTCDLTVSWDLIPMSEIERRLNAVVAMHENAARAQTLVLLWPAIQTALAHPAPDGLLSITLKSQASSRDYYAAPSPLPQEIATRQILDECGFNVISFGFDEGYYNESGSGMGGSWDRWPAVTITCKLK